MDTKIQLKCFDCGHCQETTAINPEFDDEGALVSFLAGSSYHYCDGCGRPHMIVLGFTTEADA